MSTYTKATLRAATKEAIIADIKALTWNEEQVYPDYPQDYEKSFGPFERFVVSEPRQVELEPAEFDAQGNQTKAAVMGDWECKLVLPLGYDTSHLSTLVS